MLLKSYTYQLSKCRIKKCLHECKSRGFITRCKPLVTFENRKAGLDIARKYLKKPPKLWNQILWTDENKINFDQNDGKRKVRRKKIINYPMQPITWTDSLVFINDVTEEARWLLSSTGLNSLPRIQPNTFKPWQSSSGMETHVVMSMGSRLQALTGWKEFSS